MAKGKHRAEDQADGKSTSERNQSGTRASTGDKHALSGEDTQIIKAHGSDLPSRDGSKGPGTR